MKVIIDNIFLALYSPIIIVENKTKTANDINEISGKVFDGDILMLPLPEDAPSEIPRMLLKSKDGQLSLQVSRSRIALIFQNIIDREETSFPNKGLFEMLEKISKYFSNNLNVQFRRCGMVSDWTVELEKKSVEFICENYIKNNVKINSPSEIEIRWLNKNKIKDFATNQWVFIKTPKTERISGKENLVSFRIDINSDSEKKYNFSGETIIEFLEECTTINEKIIKDHIGEK